MLNQWLVDFIMDCLKDFKLKEAWCAEHQMNDEDFFVKDHSVYCRKCNLPMKFMEVIDFCVCQGCNGTISKFQVIKAE